jgi:uncharacterized protein (TIGR02246 family)
MTSLERWMADYRTAWESNDPEEIGALFTDDAVYYTAPFAEPWRGREAIVEHWLADRDEPGETTFEWRPLVDDAGIAVITGRTSYVNGDDFVNLWVIHFAPDGRCSEFTEWYMRPKGRN